MCNKNIEVLEIPLHLVESAEFKNIDPHWISALLAGYGTFDIKVTKRKSKYQVELRFRITQHIRDANILGIIAELFTNKANLSLEALANIK